MIKIISGNIFTSTCQTLVNTVNTQGVMGAGIALEMKLRYPEMFLKYASLCERHLIEIGKLWIYEVSYDRQILNFPTKTNWKQPSRVDYLERGLRKFVTTYEERGIESIAFPLLGADKGGLDQDYVIKLMQKEMDSVTIPIEIYKYDPSAKDDIADKFIEQFRSRNETELKAIGFSKSAISKIGQALDESKLRNMGKLASLEGIGVKTLETCYNLALGDHKPTNPTLFD